MLRKFLFEFEDFSWYPESFRNVQTDFLQIIMARFDVFKEVYPKLFSIAHRLNIFHFTDLCSGGGGAILQLRKHYKRIYGNKPFSATLTDKYPNLLAYKALVLKSNREINYLATPVDVTKDLSKLSGFWTVFNAFHHLSPLNATRLLQKSVKNRQPIAIMEPLDTNALTILIQSFFLIIGLFFIIPFTKSFNLKVFFFSYLIPVLPFAIVWDGWMSALKVYRTPTLNRMVKLADSEKNYTWDIGKAKHTFGKVIFVLGSPRK